MSKKFVTAAALRAANKSFEKMTPEKKRIAIAKDVIKYLEAGKLKAGAGVYLELPCDGDGNETTALDDAGPDAEVCDVLADLTEPCTVCAIGACFTAGVLRHDKLKVGAFGHGSGTMRNYLTEWFEYEQLQLIEAAFECDWDYALGVEGNGDADNFGKGYKTDRGRLKAIMQNIIDNEGTFKP